MNIRWKEGILCKNTTLRKGIKVLLSMFDPHDSKNVSEAKVRVHDRGELLRFSDENISEKPERPRQF